MNLQGSFAYYFNLIFQFYVYSVVCILIPVTSEPTEMFWRLWPLAAASEDPPLNHSIPSCQTFPAPLLMSEGWRPELPVEQEREIFGGHLLMSGTVGSPSLENGRSAHSDSGTDWCFSLERDLVSELVSLFARRPRRTIWLVCRERPRRKRRNKSRGLFETTYLLPTLTNYDVKLSK